MRQTVSLLILLSLLGVLAPHAKAAGFHAQVVQVYTGDLIEVERSGRRGIIRLYGIFTPESSQPFGNEARHMTRGIVYRQSVFVKPAGFDPYGTMVAFVYLGQQCLNEDLVRAGLAWVHGYFCALPACAYWKRLEAVARAEQRGLWAESNAVPPWQWRRVPATGYPPRGRERQ